MLIKNSDEKAQARCCDNRLLETLFYSFENNFRLSLKTFELDDDEQKKGKKA